jgi:2-haloacid dehalogenase
MVTAQAFVFDAYGTLFDVHSVVTALQAITPEAEACSRLWRMKQLEYTWLRSLMGRYVDFWTVTEEALRFALTHYGLQLDPEQHATLLNAYLELAAYPEIPAMLAGLAPRPCVILSNGSPRMLAAAVTSSGLTGHFTHLLSADRVQCYKPDPRVYALAPEALGLPKEAVVFVSSNSFDVMGAKAYGFQVAWINRTQAQADTLGLTPDVVLTRLDALPQAFPVAEASERPQASSC